MALTSATRKVTYTGNGSTTAFAFGHLFFADADLVVKVAGVTKTLTTDYTVAGAGEQAGGTVTFGTAPAADASVTIERVVDFTQPTSLRTQGNYSPKVHENALDRVTMQTQQLDARVTTAQADADALDVRLTTAESDIDSLTADATALTARVTTLEGVDADTRLTSLEEHDTSEDAAVDLIDARVSALEAGDSPPAPVTESYQTIASAIAERTAPVLTVLASGSSLTADEIETAVKQLGDLVASLLAHAALLDVANSFSKTLNLRLDGPGLASVVTPPRTELWNIDIATMAAHVYATTSAVEVAFNAGWSSASSEWSANDPTKPARLYRFTKDGDLVLLRKADTSAAWADNIWDPDATLTVGSQCALSGDSRVTRLANGMVSVRVQVTAQANLVAQQVASIGSPSCYPAAFWPCAAVVNTAGTWSTIPAHVTSAGVVGTDAAVASGAIVYIAATYPGA